MHMFPVLDELSTGRQISYISVMYLYQEKLINITKEVSQQVIAKKTLGFRKTWKRCLFSTGFQWTTKSKAKGKGGIKHVASTRKAEDQQECML